MITLEGKYNTAKVFTDTPDSETIGQIINLLNQEFVSGSQIRIMPDTHAGAGCVIGTTMTINDKIVPNLVGVDIGCGMETVVLKDRHIELEALDKVIHQYIPAGFGVRKSEHSFLPNVNIDNLRCAKSVNLQRAEVSLGTLGGGNHFCEVGKDEDGALYLVVHSGSRHMGLEIAQYYQNAAYERLKPNIDKSLAYVEGDLWY